MFAQVNIILLIRKSWEIRKSKRRSKKTKEWLGDEYTHIFSVRVG